MCFYGDIRKHGLFLLHPEELSQCLAQLAPVSSLLKHATMLTQMVVLMQINP